jgi:hypothetical protein
VRLNRQRVVVCGLTKFLDRLEVPDPEQVLLERADEPLGAAVALGRADEGGRALDTDET